MILRSNAVVQHEEVLYGWANQMIQVYVLSNDGKWYLQEPVTFYGHGNRFSVRCFFGNDQTQSGAVFKVIAVAGTDRPRSPVDELPCGFKSNAITVVIG